MSSESERFKSICESNFRILEEVLKNNHNRIWDDDFYQTVVESRESVISKHGEQFRLEVTRRFREWRKAHIASL